MTRVGGIYVVMMPPMDKWLRVITKFQTKLITPPHKSEEVRQYLKVRFWESLMKSEGIAIYNVDDSTFIKPPQPINASEHAQGQVKLPDVKGKAIEVYRLAKTQDQVNVISTIEGMINERSKVNVVIADRDRGKLAAVGLCRSPNRA